MKISKLFHWLYACLMLLPIFAFGVTGIYYALNQTATQSETTIVETNYYNIDNSQTITLNNTQTNTIYATALELYDSVNLQFSYLELLNPYTDFQVNNNVSNIKNYITFNINSNDLFIYTNTNIYYTTQTTYLELIFVFDDTNPLNNYVANSEIVLYFISSPNIQIPNGENTTTTNTNSVSASVINAWNDTWSNPLFSWSADSFLTAPFEYVTNLFSIPSNNTFSMALSYWLAISIIYLVFDLVMYVPLLAHRWIDKGMVE